MSRNIKDVRKKGDSFSLEDWDGRSSFVQRIHDFQSLVTERGVARVGIERIMDGCGDNQNVIHHRWEILLQKILDSTHVFLLLYGLNQTSKSAAYEIQGLQPYDVEVSQTLYDFGNQCEATLYCSAGQPCVL